MQYIEFNCSTLHSIFQSFSKYFLKNEIDCKMQREKLYNLHKTALLIIAGFVFKPERFLGIKLPNGVGKHDIHEYCFFFISFFIIHPGCRASQAASFVMFCFCLRTNIELEKDEFKKNDSIVYTRSKYRRHKSRLIGKQKIEQVKK